MKKKIIALSVVVVLVCGVVAGSLIGCNLVTTNAEKDYNQVVATIQYDGLTDQVLKGELQAIYNTYGAVYVQYYGMTAEEALNTLYESLTRQSLLLLKAKAEVAKSLGITFTNDSDITDLLTYDEIRYCIQMANADFKKQWQANIDEREQEQAANDDTSSSDEGDTSDDSSDKQDLKARPVREEETPSTEYVPDESFTEENGSKLPAFFEDWYNEQLTAVQNEIDDLNEQLAAATDDAQREELQTKLEEARTRRSNMRSAYTDLRNTLADSYTDYEYYLNNQYESRVTAKYEELLGEPLTVTDAEVQEYITAVIGDNGETFVDADAYASALESGSTIIRHYDKGYFSVRSILLGFTEEQKTFLTNLTNRLGEDNVDDFRAVIALGTGALTGTDVINPDDSTIAEIVARWGSAGLGINISNTEYDETTDKLSDAYTARDVSYADVLAAMVKYIAEYKADFLATAQSLMGDDYAANESTLAQYAVNEAFTDLIYLVNDDDGMFSSDSYQVTPDGTATSYVDEYAVLARRLYKETEGGVRAEVGKMALEDYGTAMYSGTTSDASFNNDKFAEASGTAYTIYVKDMQTTVADGRTIDAPVYTFVTADGSISFIINTYGIQIVMINGYAFDEAQIGSTVTAQTEGEHTWYRLDDDYLYSVEVIVNYQLDDEFSYVLDDDGNRIISSIEVEKKTLTEHFSDSLLEGKKTDNYNTVVNEFVSSNEGDCVTKNDSVFNGLLDRITQA